MATLDAYVDLLKNAQPFVNQFCRQNNTRLLNIEPTEENGPEEPAYIFSDNLGSYTIEGIRNSLR